MFNNNAVQRQNVNKTALQTYSQLPQITEPSHQSRYKNRSQLQKDLKRKEKADQVSKSIAVKHMNQLFRTTVSPKFEKMLSKPQIAVKDQESSYPFGPV